MHMSLRLRSRLTVATLSAAVALMPFTMVRAQHQQQGMMKKEMKQMRVGLDGYCPVCLIEMKKWEKGKESIRSTFDGVTYLFPSDAVKAKFEANPAKYVPALNGDCIVCYEKHGKRVPGKPQFATLNRGRVYLFPSAKELAMFKQSPDAYVNSDLAINGECIVCMAKMNKHVPGSAEHTVFHDGLRYQFPSAREADVFRRSPMQFVSKVAPAMKSAGSAQATNSTVRLVGRSGCAGCEFGVKPISAPSELGLAVVGDDGSVTVVEDAHRRYPQIYAARFDGMRLAVEGSVVRKQGKVSWLNPTSLKVLN
ncbi:MAG: hypothetical protein Aurels2KO_40220 [Aureliella sp.]